MCDDIRFHSGVATMAREIVHGTVSQFNWFNIGGGVNHKDKGQILDVSQDVGKITKVSNADVKIMPVDNFGTINEVRYVLEHYDIDAIMLFTDPRYWIWLWKHEREIRYKVPIIYYNIWDNLPYPKWNKPYYESCDALFAISKQTENINRVVLGDSVKNKVIKYIPHGINKDVFKPVEHKVVMESKIRILGEENKDKFVLFYNSRNMRRKNTSDTIRAFKLFLDKIEKKDAILLLHTSPIDESGTNLPEVAEVFFGENWNDYIKFSNQKLQPSDMNLLYNISDATILLSNNEGWGLSITESLMAGKPIIATVTGGLQDQMRFMDGDGNDITFNEDWGSNHDGKYKHHGTWAKPVYPTTQVIVGSVPTPYIYEDVIDVKDAAEAIYQTYNSTTRYTDGLAGRSWVCSSTSMMNSEDMCSSMISGINETIEKFKPREEFNLYKI